MTTLKKMLEQKQDIKRKLTLVNIQDEIPKISSKHNDINTRGQGIGRKHIPYPENGIAARRTYIECSHRIKIVEHVNIRFDIVR